MLNMLEGLNVNYYKVQELVKVREEEIERLKGLLNEHQDEVIKHRKKAREQHEHNTN